MIINGAQEAAEGKSVALVLQEKKIDLSNVAVERNGEIVPKRLYDSVILEAEDRLEIVSFVANQRSCLVSRAKLKQAFAKLLMELSLLWRPWITPALSLKS